MTTQPALSDVLRRLESDGIVLLEDWLDHESVQRLRADVESLEQAPPRWARVPEKAHGSILNFAPLAVHRLGDGARIAAIETVFNAPFFRAICDGYLNRTWAFDRIVQERDTAREEALTPWHVDYFPNHGKCLKFFVYLSDTTEQNGAFHYVPGWHGLVREMAGELPDFRTRRRDLHVWDQLSEAVKDRASRLRSAGHEEAAEQLEEKLARASAHIVSTDRSDDHYAVTARAGTVVVFDPAGLHRGVVVRSGERLVVRSHCLEFPLGRALSSRNDMTIYLRRGMVWFGDRLSGEPSFV